MKHRVVVTGAGLVTSLGNTVEEFWENIKNGKCGIGEITRFPLTDDYKVKFVAEVKDIDFTKHIPKKELKRLDRYAQFGVYAAKEALIDSGLDMEKEDATRIGMILGSGIGGLETLENAVIVAHEKGVRRLSPFTIPMSISNMAAGNAAIHVGAKGICTSVVTACASGTHSIGDAFKALQQGENDVIFAGGAEATITRTGVGGFQAITALSTATELDRASIPFDKERSGFVMGEGAGVLVLETLEHATKRGAKILAEVVGYGATGDAYHITSPAPGGEGAVRSMDIALKNAGISPSDIGYINAHGTSTEYNDKFETQAIKTVFGDDTKVPVSSTKSMTGHLLGAAGAIESIILIQALRTGFLPATINLKVADEECDLDYIPNVGREQEIKYAMSNSLGFGGHNGTLIFKKWEGQ
ncbi:MAG: beta-ketoacyl-[acyl-carrier-protein] synthase II [Epulopiscium sp. Nuni2H_MBin003]|nr:MAG: beta-ketoacyl-[acyl-carrier-protein] synthase II [Epulopiscium sp. Nuni2H_MBin003]